MKLNLGCGTDIKDGYVNVDARKTHPSVKVLDLAFLPWGIEAESADEILMLDFLEHFPVAHTEKILRECFRVLKRKGKLVVQVPDFDHLARAIRGPASGPADRDASNARGTAMLAAADARQLAAPGDVFPLSIDPSGRFLRQADGKPFLIHGASHGRSQSN